ncbi:MAG: amidohydrolase family protein, partial [Synergistaceae bacterium]|nr:amidohydrolase family protein [Synergistaceae bacterium]
MGEPLPLENLLALLTSRPAALLPRQWRSLGTLREGAMADITVLDLDRAKVVDVREWKSKSRLTPWNGEILQGWPVMTLAEGRIVMDTLGEGE